MPTTTHGITYPDSDSHARIWEHIQTAAEDTDDLLGGRLETVRARVKDNTGGPIATAEAIEKTCAITIPASWATYDIEVQVFVRLIETIAATGNTTITLRARKTNTAGAEWGRTLAVIADSPPGNGGPAPFAGYAEGETATGAITVAFTAVASGNNGFINWNDLIMFVEAIRTS